MTDETFPSERYVLLAAEAAGIDLPPELRAAVLQHFAILAEHAAHVMAAGLDDDIEPAPVFRP